LSVELWTRMSRSISFIDRTNRCDNRKSLARLRDISSGVFAVRSTVLYEKLLKITLGHDRGCTLGSFVGIYLPKTCSV
jgi:hypothetical protein